MQPDLQRQTHCCGQMLGHGEWPVASNFLNGHRGQRILCWMVEPLRKNFTLLRNAKAAVVYKRATKRIM